MNCVIRFFMLLCIISFCSVCFVVASANAVEHLVFVSYISVATEYDANYWLSENNERGVYRLSLKPGFDFGYTTDRSEVTLNYVMSMNTYHDTGSVPTDGIHADEADFVGHDLSLFAQNQLTDRIRVALDESYILTRDPGSSDIYNNDVERYKYSLNRVTPQLRYTLLDEFYIELEYQNTLKDYSLSSEEDSIENRGRLNFTYDLNQYNSFSLKYQIWNRDYDQDSTDYTSNQLKLHYNREATYLKYDIGAGYQDRSFDDSDMDNLDGFTWNAGLTYENRNKLSISLSQNLNDDGSGDSYYTATRLDASINRLCLDKINITVSGSYQNSDYEDSEIPREDDTWDISGSVSYPINDRFTLDFKVGYETRDSDNAGYDYDNTYGSLIVKFDYDFLTR